MGKQEQLRQARSNQSRELAAVGHHGLHVARSHSSRRLVECPRRAELRCGEQLVVGLLSTPLSIGEGGCELCQEQASACCGATV